MSETVKVTLKDGSSITLTVQDATLDTSKKFPHNTLKRHTIAYDTPSGIAGVPIDAVYAAAPATGGGTGTGGTGGTGTGGTGTGAASPGVLLVMMETNGLAALKGNGQAPFINASMAAFAWAAVTALGHNSAVDYVMMASGVNVSHGQDADSTIQGDGIDTKFDGRKTIFDQVQPSVVYVENGSVDYRNPVSFFPHIASLAGVQVNRDFPSNLVKDLNGATPPRFSFLIPNNTDNMHSSSIGAGDTFLKNLVGEVQATAWYKAGGTIVVLWDEDDSAGGDSPSAADGGTVLALVISLAAAGKGQAPATSTTAGVLGSIEDALGVPRLGAAVGAPALPLYITPGSTGTGGTGGGTGTGGTGTGGTGTGGTGTGGTGSGGAQPPAAAKTGAVLFDALVKNGALDPAFWVDGWQGGQNFNNFPLDPTLITVDASGVVTLGQRNGTGCFMTTDPTDGRSSGGFQFTDGYAEAEVWLPGSGSNIAGWPTFWLDGHSWPNTGETDVVEGGSDASNSIGSNYHSGGAGQSGNDVASNHGIKDASQFGLAPWCGRWLRVGVDRQSGLNVIYYDGIEVVRYQTFDKLAPNYLLLSNGTNSPGGDFKVRRVRVWAHA